MIVIYTRTLKNSFKSGMVIEILPVWEIEIFLILAFFSFLGADGGPTAARRHHHRLNRPVNGSEKRKDFRKNPSYPSKKPPHIRKVRGEGIADNGSRPFVPYVGNTHFTDQKSPSIEDCRPLCAMQTLHRVCTPQRGTRAVFFFLHCLIPHPCGSPSWSVFSAKTLTITDSRTLRTRQ